MEDIRPLMVIDGRYPTTTCQAARPHSVFGSYVCGLGSRKGGGICGLALSARQQRLADAVCADGAARTLIAKRAQTRFCLLLQMLRIFAHSKHLQRLCVGSFDEKV